MHLNQAANHISVCIPAYKEPNIIGVLDSLSVCNANGLSVKVYVFVNGSNKDDRVTFDTNLQSFAMVNDWVEHYDGHLEFEVFMDLDLPVKDAGVGLARKILGDKACQDFYAINKNGTIAYLDADCTVSENYLISLFDFFNKNKFQAAAIHFEHPIEDVKEDYAIIEYEAHLRYYILMQEWAGFPFAIHTVGSSMAVTASAYRAKGGMNKRKAGEDFYFLQKYIKDQVCGTLTNCTVFPSSRNSNRVPFGTGRAMLSYGNGLEHWESYHPNSFIALKELVAMIPDWYNQQVDISRLNSVLHEYLLTINFSKKVEKIRDNVASEESFIKRVFQFFDAFQLMKCLHYMRDKKFPDLEINLCLKWYLQQVLGQEYIDTFDSLKKLRKIQQKDI